MISPNLTPFILGALLVLAAGACSNSSRSTSHSIRLGSFNRTRTAEELRIFNGPLTITVDPQDGYGSVTIPGTDKAPLSLFLFPDDLSKLRALDKTQPYEVRYWYHEEGWLPDTMFGRGELASIRNAAGVILDRSRCAVHDFDMVRRPVPISYGMPMREQMDAMKRDFPHPAFTLGGCVIDEGAPKDETHYVCAKCDAAAKAWTASFLTDRKRAPGSQNQ